MARTSNEFGGGEIVPAIEAITGIQAPVMEDFVAVPFGTVNHEHGERRQIQNLTNNLKGSSGIERIPFNGIDELDTEQGPNGETVHALNTGDSRIRFVGSGWFFGNNGVGPNTEGFFVRGPNLNDYVEITFYGTHLNLLTFMSNPGTVPDWRVSSDGGTTEGSNVFISTSNAINQAGVKSNVILPVFSSTTAGVHTIRIRNAIASSNGLTLFGCEVINENAAITQQPGADFDGRVELLGATTFPIKPDNTTVSSLNSRSGASEAFTGTTGARVLNYLTSGGQLKQSFDIADEAPVVQVAGEQEYTIILNSGGSTSVTIPTSVTSFVANTFGAGGGGGGSLRSNPDFGFGPVNAVEPGGGGGGGAKATATYSRDDGNTAAVSLAVVVGSGGGGGTGGNGGNGVASTVTVGGTDILTGNGGTAGTLVLLATGTGGSGPGGTVTTNADITNWTRSTDINTAGTAGDNATATAGNSIQINGGAGGAVGGFGNTPLVSPEGQGGAITTNDGNPGNVPGGGGAGAGNNTAQPNGQARTGGAGAAGRIYFTITAASGLSETDFGVTTGEFTAGASTGGVLGASTAIFGNTAFDTNRLNQEVIRRINFREFGANSAFATGTASRAFTLDDGTTTLVSGSQVTIGNDILSLGNVSNPTDAFFVLTFVGTGLDVIWSMEGTDVEPVTVTVDGLSIGTFTPTANESFVVRPIVSGLAYGTHTVRFANNNNPGTSANNYGVSDFVLYGPKKPEIPTLDAGSLELSDYNIMRDYSANSTAGLLTIGGGVLRKEQNREFLYTGAVSLATSTAHIGGYNVNFDDATSTGRYTFYGTGFDLRYVLDGNAAGRTDISIDGNLLTSTNFPSPVTATAYGSGNNFDFTNGQITTVSGTATAVGSGLSVTGLSLGVHTLLVDNMTAVDWHQGPIDVITPIHINDDTLKIGSEGLNNLTIDPVVEEDEAVVLANRGEAKAWINYDPVNNRVLSSFNIAAALETTTNNSQLQVFFDKPFKDANYVALSQVLATSPGGTGNIVTNGFKQANFCRMQTESSADTFGIFAAFYGELIDE